MIENQELRTRLGMDALVTEEVSEAESKVNLVIYQIRVLGLPPNLSSLPL